MFAYSRQTMSAYSREPATAKNRQQQQQQQQQPQKPLKKGIKQKERVIQEEKKVDDESLVRQQEQQQQAQPAPTLQKKFEVDSEKIEHVEVVDGKDEKGYELASNIPWINSIANRPPTPHKSPLLPKREGQQQQVGKFDEGTLDKIPPMPHEQKQMGSGSGGLTSFGTDDGSSVSSRSAVSFGHVRVREYERVIDTSMYMGLSLGWAYNEAPPIRLDEAEQDKDTQQQNQQMTIQKSKSADSMDDDNDSKAESAKTRKKKPPERFSMFLMYGYTRKQLKQATAEAAKAIKQREREAARRLILEEKQKAAEAATSPTNGGVGGGPATPKRKAWRSSWL